MGKSMIKTCPNPICSYYKTDDAVQKDGTFFRASDSRTIQRFRCRHCGKRFSAASFSDEYRHNHRRITPMLKKLLVSGVSLRRSALLLGVSRVTATRRFILLAKRAEQSQLIFLKKLEEAPVKEVQFDDLITIEHTKMKPLTVSIAVDSSNRAVLGAKVGRIPAFGKLAKKSRKKYGRRLNEHRITLLELFKTINKSIDQQAKFRSDLDPLYPKVLRKYFKEAAHETFKGGRACVAGQGELKRKGNDPLFYINHTCAIFRANINRLFRKTWCTTKSPLYLQHHLNLFIDYYNQEYLKLG